MSIFTRAVHPAFAKSILNNITVPTSGVLPMLRQSSSLTANSHNEYELKNDNTTDLFEAKRNKSRLKFRHYNILHGQMPVDPKNPYFPYENTVAFRKKLVARHGLESGINLGIAWPTRKEINSQIEYENVAHPFTINEMVETKKTLREAERKKIMDRQNEISLKMSKLASWMKELRDKNHKKEQTARAAQEKKDALIEEVRQHFGYVVNIKDPKFQEMMVQKEKEAKKAEKEIKKKVRTEKNAIKAVAFAKKLSVEKETKPE